MIKQATCVPNGIGGYHVFALDPDYRWALVAGPSKSYLWILAREPHLPPDILAELVETADRAGFDTGSLIYPPNNQGNARAPVPTAGSNG